MRMRADRGFLFRFVQVISFLFRFIQLVSLWYISFRFLRAGCAAGFFCKGQWRKRLLTGPLLLRQVRFKDTRNPGGLKFKYQTESDKYKARDNAADPDGGRQGKKHQQCPQQVADGKQKCPQ